MTRFMVKCLECKGKFIFRHPAIGSVERLREISIDCPHCSTSISMDPTQGLPMLQVDMNSTTAVREKLGIKEPEPGATILSFERESR